MKIGTRKSTMALAQTDHVAALLRDACPGLDVEIVKFQTRGDADQKSKLDRHGGKGGAFVAELRAAMLAGELQAAMHSLKDIPGNEETPGLMLAAMLERDDPADALVLRPDLTLDDLKADEGRGYCIGTNAVRRAAYLKRLFPQAQIIHYRGAADTRIRKLDQGEPQKLPDGSETPPADALVMAKAGLARVGASERCDYTFTHDEILPAVAQGIVTVECAQTDHDTQQHLSLIEDPDARAAADAEREVLWILNGHCNSPIAGISRKEGADLILKASVISEDGQTLIETEMGGDAQRPRELGRAVGLDLLAQGAGKIITDTAPTGNL